MRTVAISGSTDYGFRWGPMLVERACHIEGRGYSIQIQTEHKVMQIYVSEAGRVIRAYEATER